MYDLPSETAGSGTPFESVAEVGEQQAVPVGRLDGSQVDRTPGLRFHRPVAKL